MPLSWSAGLACPHCSAKHGSRPLLTLASSPSNQLVAKERVFSSIYTALSNHVIRFAPIAARDSYRAPLALMNCV